MVGRPGRGVNETHERSMRVQGRTKETVATPTSRGVTKSKDPGNWRTFVAPIKLPQRSENIQQKKKLKKLKTC